MHKRVLLLVIFSSLFISPSVQGGTDIIAVEIKGLGSIPPVPEFYKCANDLKGKLFDELAVQKCLQSILRDKHFESGKIETKRVAHGLQVRFVLRSPMLTLSDVNLGLPTSWKKEFEEFSSWDKTVLHVGDIYEGDRDVSTMNMIETFLRFKGKRATVSQEINLDYEKKYARLSFLISEGPDEIAHPSTSFPEYRCKNQSNIVFERNDDDFTPFRLARSLMKIHSPMCFSISAVKEDQEALRRSGLFMVADLTVAGSGDIRKITMKIHAKPLQIGEVSLRGYGLLTAEQFEGIPHLPIRVNEVYRNSNAELTLGALRAHYSKPEQKLDIFEDDEVMGDGKLRVTFHLLAAPNDELIMDGLRVSTEHLEE